MLSAINIRLYSNLVLFIIILVSGIFLNHTGKPYNSILFTIHKFSTLGLIIYLSIIIVKYLKSTSPAFLFIISMLLAVLFILILFFSGAMLSLGKMGPAMFILHCIAAGGGSLTLIYIFYILFYKN